MSKKPTPAKARVMTPERLEERLATIGWSGKGLAARFGINVSTVYQWLKGEVRVPDAEAAWIETIAAFIEKHPAPPRTPRAAYVGPADPERLERVRRLAGRGMSSAEAGRVMGENPKTLRNFAAAHGVKFGKPKGEQGAT